MKIRRIPVTPDRNEVIERDVSYAFCVSVCVRVTEQHFNVVVLVWHRYGLGRDDAHAYW